MPNKCTSCRFFRGAIARSGPGGFEFDVSTCLHIDLPEPLNEALTICDDDHFVYFEPKTPAGGAAFVQITREPAKTMTAAA